MRHQYAALLATCLLGSASALLQEVSPSLCDADVQQYSGYFTLTTGTKLAQKHYFYWFFEARNQPETAPVLLWMTGGPGCSSAVALFGENGPCHVSPDGSFTTKNNFSWNEVANIIFIDQPAGTGFSYGLGMDHNETSVANDMYDFLQQFFTAHPKYSANPFYTFGESFAGHYVPAVTHKIWQMNQQLHAGQVRIPLVGTAIGNGLVDPLTQFKVQGRPSPSTQPNLPGAGGHASLKSERRNPAAPVPARICGWLSPTPTLPLSFALLTHSLPPRRDSSARPCVQYYAEMVVSSNDHKPAVSNVTHALMRASLGPCLAAIRACQAAPATCVLAIDTCNIGQLLPYTASGMNPYDMRVKCAKPPLCYDFSNVANYLGQKAVKAALGVPESRNWADCNRAVALSFELSGDWMQSFQDKLPDQLASGIRVLVYAGDQDYICNWLGNQAWTREMKWPGKAAFGAAEVTEWKVHGQPAGTIQTASNFTFLRVYDAGHMVPRDQPVNALAMVKSFIASEF